MRHVRNASRCLQGIGDVCSVCHILRCHHPFDLCLPSCSGCVDCLHVVGGVPNCLGLTRPRAKGITRLLPPAGALAPSPSSPSPPPSLSSGLLPAGSCFGSPGFSSVTVGEGPPISGPVS